MSFKLQNVDDDDYNDDVDSVSVENTTMVT
jgi:hypothetical protein